MGSSKTSSLGSAKLTRYCGQEYEACPRSLHVKQWIDVALSAHEELVEALSLPLSLLLVPWFISLPSVRNCGSLESSLQVIHPLVLEAASVFPK